MSITPIFSVDARGIVTNITIASFTMNTEATKSYWANYTPEKIFDLYGEPSEIHIMSSSRVSELNGQLIAMYYIFLEYQQYGFFIKYSGQTPFQEMEIFCPSYESPGNLDGYDIDINLSKSGTLNPVAEKEYFDYGLIKTLFDASGVTVHEFFDYYINTGSMMCIEVPRNLWP